MNMAALGKLPVVFLAVNNQHEMGTRIDKASTCLRLVERAETFSVRGAEVDGMEVEALFQMETGKSTMDVESVDAGFLCSIMAGEGRAMKMAEQIAVIAEMMAGFREAHCSAFHQPSNRRN
jgi:hypothetical protein